MVTWPSTNTFKTAKLKRQEKKYVLLRYSNKKDAFLELRRVRIMDPSKENRRFGQFDVTENILIEPDRISLHFHKNEMKSNKMK